MSVSVCDVMRRLVWRISLALGLCAICLGQASAQGICAEVRLRISQEAVMTRSAFKATLELSNGSSTASVQNVGAQVCISTLPDNNVADGNDLFAGASAAVGLIGEGLIGDAHL